MLAGLEPANVPLGEDDLQKGAAIAKNFPPRVVKQMDLSVDPCEDFYSYACGGFMEHTQIPEDLGGFARSWDGGSAEHARVVMALPGKLLRLRGSLGPLQDMAVTGVLTVRLEPKDDGTEAIVTYRLSGAGSHQRAQFAPIVDQVLGQQSGAFAALANKTP